MTQGVWGRRGAHRATTDARMKGDTQIPPSSDTSSERRQRQKSSPGRLAPPWGTRTPHPTEACTGHMGGVGGQVWRPGACLRCARALL